jgi:hypothetical protein
MKAQGAITGLSCSVAVSRLICQGLAHALFDMPIMAGGLTFFNTTSSCVAWAKPLVHTWWFGVKVASPSSRVLSDTHCNWPSGTKLNRLVVTAVPPYRACGTLCESKRRDDTQASAGAGAFTEGCICRSVRAVTAELTVEQSLQSI